VFFTSKRSVIEILDKKEDKAKKFWKERHEARMRRTVGNCRPVFVSVVVLTKDLRARTLSCYTRDTGALNFGIE
jgi:hypothetical protein